MVLPVGAPAAASNNGGPNRNYGLKSGSLLLQHKRHGRQWLTLDPSSWVDEAQGEEEAEAEAEAEAANDDEHAAIVRWLRLREARGFRESQRALLLGELALAEALSQM